MRNKNVLIYVIGSVVIIGIISIVLVGKKSNSSDSLLDAECSQICEHANSVCSSLIDLTTCKSKCNTFNDEIKNYLKNATSCEELTKKPELLSEVITPQMNTPEQKTATNDCEAACNKYVMSCLTLVPNASESLFNDGYNSCLSDCSGWNVQKVECMISAFDCPAMTDVCGL